MHFKCYINTLRVLFYLFFFLSLSPPAVLEGSVCFFLDCTIRVKLPFNEIFVSFTY